MLLTKKAIGVMYPELMENEDGEGQRTNEV